MPLPIRVQGLVKELAQSSWMTWAVSGTRAGWLIADTQLLTTAITVMMLVLVATGLVSTQLPCITFAVPDFTQSQICGRYTILYYEWIHTNISSDVCNNGDIRLMGGSTMYEGRVELCYNETWGTICDGFWNVNDANVACRQLGFLDNGTYSIFTVMTLLFWWSCYASLGTTTGATAYPNAFFGHGTGPILLDDLACNGREARLIDCPRITSQGIGTYDFCPNGHGEDAGVGCPARKCHHVSVHIYWQKLPDTDGKLQRYVALRLWHSCILAKHT